MRVSLALKSTAVDVFLFQFVATFRLIATLIYEKEEEKKWSLLRTVSAGRGGSPKSVICPQRHLAIFCGARSNKANNPQRQPNHLIEAFCWEWKWKKKREENKHICHRDQLLAIATLAFEIGGNKINKCFFFLFLFFEILLSFLNSNAEIFPRHSRGIGTK